ERRRDQPDAADPMDTVADAVDTPAESTEDPGHAADTPTGGNGDRGNGGRVNTDDTAARTPGEAAQAIESPSTVSDDSTTDAAHTVDEREHVTAPKEDAGAASDSPQQDPGAGGTDITPGS